MKKLILLLSLTILFAGNSFSQSQPPKVEETKAKRISYGIVVDNSGSLRVVLEEIIRSGQTVIEENSGDDKTFIVRFVDEEKTKVVQPLTNQTEKLGEALGELYVEGGQTAISQAILFSAEYLVEHEEDANRQKILVVITDGEERDDKKFLKETLDYLQRNKIKVFFLGLPSLAQSAKSANKFMNFYAEGTGGQVFVADKSNNLKLAVQSLVEIIRKN